MVGGWGQDYMHVALVQLFYIKFIIMNDSNFENEILKVKKLTKGKVTEFI